MFRIVFGGGRIGCRRNSDVQRTAVAGNNTVGKADKPVPDRATSKVVKVFPSCCTRWR